jgi:hypothetical protein
MKGVVGESQVYSNETAQVQGLMLVQVQPVQAQVA